ncbi:hypothetical protein DFH94DRAFT_205965, partial [Russula ochroleuca]
RRGRRSLLCATRLVYFFFAQSYLVTPPFRVERSVAKPTFTARRLRKLPAVEVGRASNKRDMHAHVTVHTGAIETNIQAKRGTNPRRIAGLAIKTHLDSGARGAPYR